MRFRRAAGRGRAIPVAVLTLLPLLIQIPAWSGWLSIDPLPLLSGLGVPPNAPLIAGASPWLDPNVGWTTQALGHLAATDWLRGVVPWWNPYTGVGIPLAGEMQPGALFLPFVLLLRFAAGFLLLRIVLQAIAGIATWALLDELGAAAPAAVAGGVLFELNGTFAWLSDAPAHPIAFLPLLIFGIERARFHGGVAWIGIAVALLLLAGFPETVYLGGLLALGWFGVRLAQAPAEARAGLALRVTLGGTAGIMIAAPALWSFAHLLLHGDSAGHWMDLGHPALPTAGLEMLLFPYAMGLPHAVSGVDPIASRLWASMGGYLSLPLLAAALAGCAGTRLRPLRVLLAGWIIVCLGRSFGVPLITEAVDRVPLVAAVTFYRYAPPSWELAACLLAGLGLDDLYRGERLAARAWLAGAGFAALAGIAALAAAWPVTQALFARAFGAAIWFGAAIAWAAAITAALAFLGWRRRPRSAAMLLAADAVLMFALPMLAGVRDARIDRAPVDFLRAHLGLARFYTLGPLQPNYGAYFGLASIDHNALPLPRRWVRYIRRNLDPYAAFLPSVFAGNQPRNRASDPDQAAELRVHLSAYEALGVRYVLFRPGHDPFATPMSVATAGGNVPRPLGPRDAITGVLPGSVIEDGTVARASVVVGTYGGHADGRLAITLCTARSCASGTADLAGAPDNAPLAIELAPPLAVAKGQPVRWRITHLDGTAPVAVWLWSVRDQPRHMVPRLLLYPPLTGGIRRVFADLLVAIDELPNPVPYFQASGCDLRFGDRTSLAADCPAPTRLTRRELFFSGWRARINGRAVPIRRMGPLFQVIDLPAGHSDVRFTFAPPGILWAWLACAFGLVLLLAGRTAALFSGRNSLSAPRGGEDLKGTAGPPGWPGDPINNPALR